jgi:hypothetical protein
MSVRRSDRQRKIGFPAWIRVLSAFAALLIAGEHSLASLHQALTPHDICAEHGELVHAEHQAIGETAHGTAPAVDEGPQAEPEHHHCGVVPAAPGRAPVVASDSECAFGAAALEPSTVLLHRSAVTSDVLAFAPKASPPA